MTAHHTVAEAYKQFALICLGHMADAGDPALRVWWTSAAREWQDSASRKIAPAVTSDSESKFLRLWIDPQVAGIRALGGEPRHPTYT